MYFSCLLLMAPRRRSRIYATASKAGMPNSINAIATSTGALGEKVRQLMYPLSFVSESLPS